MSYRKRLEQKLGRQEKHYETERLMKDKRSEEYEALEQVFDRPTLMTVYEFLNKGIIDKIYGAFKAGKESRLYWGKDQIGKTIAIKIFLTFSSAFKRSGMMPYIEGDPRFRKVKRDTRSLIYAWAQKEFRNLKEARKAGVNVPKPIAVSHNVLVMQFIGENGKSAPLLREKTLRDPEHIYNILLTNLKKLNQKAKLVHGDLSEYNIMIWRNKPILFDFSQAVPLEHPLADELLRRDIEIVNRYFKKLGVNVFTFEETIKRVTGIDS